MQVMSKQNINKKSPLFSLINRFMLFLVAFVLVILFVYIGGNWQFFLDTNQRFLLLVISVISIVLFFMLLIGFVIVIKSLVVTKSLYYMRYLFLYMLYTIVSLFLFLFSNFLHFFSN